LNLHAPQTGGTAGCGEVHVFYAGEIHYCFVVPFLDLWIKDDYFTEKSFKTGGIIKKGPFTRKMGFGLGGN
jgi:hypothetical protein